MFDNVVGFCAVVVNNLLWLMSSLVCVSAVLVSLTHKKQRRNVDRLDRIADWSLEGSALQRIDGFLIKHTLPMVQIGFGKASLGHKLMALLHAFYLVSLRGKWILPLVRSLLGTISDYGTERGAARTKPIPWKQVFPFFKSPSAEMDFDGEIEFAPQSDTIDLSGCVDVAGLLHVIHNCGRGLETVLMCFQDASFRLTKLANLLREPESKERLQQTCFNDDVGRVLFAKGLKGFTSHCHTDRWGAVADTILAMNKDTYAALNHGWCLGKYLDGSDAPNNYGDEVEASCLELVDTSIKDPFWQCYWRMLRRIAKVILHCMSWAEGCCCHEGLLRGASGDDSD